MSQSGEAGAEDRVRKWKEIKTTRKLEGVAIKNISAVVQVIKDEVNLKEGGDKFGEILEKMFNESTSSGASSKLIGDLNDDTMIFAIFHCIKAAGKEDKIDIAYVVNTLATDLPRQNTRLDIGVVKDFSHKDLTEKMVDHLTKDSEAEIAKMTEATQTTSVPMEPEPVAEPEKPAPRGGAPSFWCCCL